MDRYASEALYDFISNLHSEGLPIEQVHARTLNEFASVRSLWNLPISQVESAVRVVYAAKEADKADAVKAAAKETKAVALYDALTALGWKPPE